MICPHSQQIDKDLKRSKHKNDKTFIEKVRRILTCYSIRNSSIGYCQGFNFIVERILNVMSKGTQEEIESDEEETFWIFVQFLEEILPINYYSELAGVIIDTTIINEFLKKYFPDLREFFTRNDFEVSNFVHKWLVTLFTENFQEETTNLIWDYVFLEGNIVLIKSCLIMFSILRQSILKNDNNIGELFMLFSMETNNIKPNNNNLIFGFSLKQYEFNEEYIEKTRDMLSFSIVENIDKDNKEKFIKKSELLNHNEKIENNNHNNTELKCNLNWPICINENEFSHPITVVKYLVLQHKKNENLRENYFFKEAEKEHKKEEEEYTDILIERREHTCISKENNMISRLRTESTTDEMKGKNERIKILGDSPTNEKGIDKEVLIYKKMSENVTYMEAKEKISKEFKAKPYSSEETMKKYALK